MKVSPEVVAEYTKLFGKTPTGCWSQIYIECLIKDKKAEISKRKEERDVREAERLAQETLRKDRIAKRGKIEDFVRVVTGDSIEDEFRFVVAGFLRDIGVSKGRIAKRTAAIGSQETYPTYQLEWADELFSDAAKVEVYEDLIHSVEHGLTIEEICKHFVSRAVSMNSHVPNSTSPSSLLVTQHRNAQFAVVADRLLPILLKVVNVPT